jgi:PAT family beta-lactamase induction signal transducer AmpG
MPVVMSEAPKPTLLQALKDRRVAAVLLMAFASGLPFNLSGFTLQAWLTHVGLDIKAIGLFSLVSFPYIFKFLWAPLLDRYLPPFMGRRRGWVFIFQIGLVICIGAMGSFSPLTAPKLLAAAAILMVFLSASQDIVVDAYRVDAIPPSERGIAAAATTLGYRSAAMLASTVLVLLADFLEPRVGTDLAWRGGFLMVAALMAASTLATLRAPEPDAPGVPPQTLLRAIVLPLRDLLFRDGSWRLLTLVLLYKLGDAFALSLYSFFMIKGVGFTLTELSLAGKANMTISTIIGVTIGGILYLRWGMFRSLLILGIAQALTNLLYMWLALAGKKVWLLALATSLDTGVGGMGQAAFVGFLISQCNPSFSATQYAVLSTIATIPRTITGYIASFVAAAVGWPNFFIITCLSATPGLLVLIMLRRRINELAARDAPKR